MKRQNWRMRTVFYVLSDHWLQWECYALSLLYRELSFELASCCLSRYNMQSKTLHRALEAACSFLLSARLQAVTKTTKTYSPPKAKSKMSSSFAPLSPLSLDGALQLKSSNFKNSNSRLWNIAGEQLWTLLASFPSRTSSCVWYFSY